MKPITSGPLSPSPIPTPLHRRWGRGVGIGDGAPRPRKRLPLRRFSSRPHEPGVQARGPVRRSTFPSTWSSMRSRPASAAQCESMRISANARSDSHSVAFVRRSVRKRATRLAMLAPAFALLRTAGLDAVVTATPRCCSIAAILCGAAPTGARARWRAPSRSRRTRLRSRRPPRAGWPSSAVRLRPRPPRRRGPFLGRHAGPGTGAPGRPP